MNSEIQDDLINGFGEEQQKDFILYSGNSKMDEQDESIIQNIKAV